MNVDCELSLVVELVTVRVVLLRSRLIVSSKSYVIVAASFDFLGLSFDLLANKGKCCCDCCVQDTAGAAASVLRLQLRAPLFSPENRFLFVQFVESSWFDLTGDLWVDRLPTPPFAAGESCTRSITEAAALELLTSEP